MKVFDLDVLFPASWATKVSSHLVFILFGDFDALTIPPVLKISMNSFYSGILSRVLVH